MNRHRGVEQLVAHVAHNHEVAGSSPASPTANKQTTKYAKYTKGVLIIHLPRKAPTPKI